MSDQLHDVLTRIADQAGPGPSDPTLWLRARQSRRRREVMLASVVVVAVIALLTATALAIPGLRSAPPAVRGDHAGIPILVHGVDGTGGLPLETDLAVGRASVAFSNGEDAFVITANDGLTHRIKLPGFDAALYDEAHPGLSLSPDGTRLAYSWRDDTGARDTGFGPMAAPRILDLATGALAQLPVNGAELPLSVGATATWGYSWSPDGRKLVYEVWAPVDWGHPLHCCGHGYVGFDTTLGSIYVTSRWDTDDPAAGNELPRDHDVFPGITVSDSGLVAHAEGPELAVWQGTSGTRYRLPGDEDWTVGSYSSDGTRLLLEPLGVGSALALAPGTYDPPLGGERITLLPLDSTRWPLGAKIDVLGWVGDRHALLLVHRATAPDAWERDADLVLLAVEPGAPQATVVGRVAQLTDDSAFTFAAALASVDDPTRDFG